MVSYTYEKCAGTIVGFSCRGDGLSDKSAELEIRFLHASSKSAEGMHVTAGAAPQAFTTFATISMFAYQHGLPLDIEIRRGPLETPVITFMSVKNKV